MTDIELRTFAFAFLGSLIVEVANIVRTYDDGKVLSVRYKRPIYLIARLLLACGGGILAVAEKASSDILAFHIGAATPAILQMITSKTPRENS